ncbi:MAG: PolC-type DNA polymerase III [Lachnospiraceae bacterium]|nr:PolC-type DNA polymerase III [Lachnospiraceae bacterium]
MTKAFFDAFPTIATDDEELSSLLEHTTVTRVCVSEKSSQLKIYLDADRLIPKRQIEKIEKNFDDEFAAGQGLSTRIIEHFHLSGQYTPKNLMRVYRSSILHELQGFQQWMYTMFRGADIRFSDDETCVIEVEDRLIFRSHADELKRILDKIFTERFGLNFKCTIRFRESSPAEDLSYSHDAAEDESRFPYIDASVSGSHSSDQSDAAVSEDLASSSKTDQAAGRQEASSESGSADPSGSGAASPHAGRNNRKRYTKKGRGSFTDRELIQSRNPDVVYGRDFQEEAVSISSITDAIGTVVIRGQVMSLETRDIHTRTGRDLTIVLMSVSDFTDTISVKLFIDTDKSKELLSGVRAGMFLKIKGSAAIDRFDSDLAIGSVSGMKKIADFRPHRMDDEPVKRVELHCHTKMSKMDAVSDVKEIVKTAVDWGHSAIAITDHGGVQALPDAWHAVPGDSDFKVIYGCEAYLVDDEVRAVVNGKSGQSFTDAFVVFDLETTGFSPVSDRIIEIGAVRIEDGEITGRFSEFVNPKRPIPFRIEQLTSINDSMVMDAGTIEEILPRFLEFCGGAVMVGHNVTFDISFIEENCERLGIPHDFTTADTMTLARNLLPNLSRFKLDQVAKALGVSLDHHHRAVDDAECTAGIFLKFMSMLRDRGLEFIDEINTACAPTREQIRHLHYYHIILLAQNETGRVNLYRCVSESHLNYMFGGRPLLPRSFLSEHREGLIIGSACEAGELFQAIERGATPRELKKLVDYYDYLEIQPLGNNEFLTVPKYDKNGNLKNEPKSIEDLKNYNRRIVQLGEQYSKPVVATCDVHFLNPEDAIYREILMADFDDGEKQPPLYLRTTREMLDEFEYLGEEKAREVVITNTNLIADRIERFSPVRPDKCPPVIPDSDETLTRLCYDKAHEIYGEVLPDVVEQRLKRELNSIISNGFAVMYIIAQKLVWKSVADGYLVGSRGSVGSSFVANMAGITEVNSLHPHYLCPECHFVDFDSEQVRKFDGMAGCDMPDRMCPKCGTRLLKLGFDIPFETFLGFKGNKEPDIDLNFSGEYQSKAHKYTEVIFGAGQTYRAGTVTGVAEKTAYGYVKKYFEQKGEHRRRAEIERLSKGITDVRKSTGQHPGGIIVLPYGEDINSFTPVQHPPTDENTITTHFDYHKIDHNLLKLDILGHDDPTMIRMLEDLTGVSATDVPLDDKGVMSLFQDTHALGISPEDIGGCPLGSLGIPEFGTDFAIQMLVDTKPKYFSDLVRIAGLAHGTDVWLGNAQDLILSGTCTISTAICTRDDIMIYLIGKGMDPELSFSIMEKVRKGKGLTKEWEEEMRAHDVPEWYITSCKKIKYMFPKAHAAAYVMMAWRIAWFKINEPLAYYAAYFSIRSPGFDYELMCMGPEALKRHMEEYESKDASLIQPKEQEQYKAMKVVREMYARGYEFMKIDLDRCRATKMCIVEGKIMPCLNKIDGLGDNVAAAITDAVKDGPFLSLDNFRERTGCPKTIVEKLVKFRILEGLPESNQLSIFDLMNAQGG